MKAQLSMEFILLLTISVMALSILFISFDKLSSASSFSSKRAFFIRESSFFYEISKDLCISGDGNVRIVEFPYPFEVNYNPQNKEVHLNSTYGSMHYPLNCKVDRTIVKGKVKMENVNGMIIIKP